MKNKSKYKINKKVYFISVLILLVGIFLANKSWKENEFRNKISSGDEPQLNKILLSTTLAPTLSVVPNENIHSNITFPSIAEFTGPELDKILTLKPGVSTKNDVDTLIGETLTKGWSGDYVHTIVVESGKDEMSRAGVFFYFNENNVLKKIHYYNSDFAAKIPNDITTYLGTPNMVYLRSPSNANYIEYVYATRGITFMERSNEIKAITLYEPKTLHDYVQEYEDMLPYDVSL